jgi:hypothetical protein
MSSQSHSQIPYSNPPHKPSITIKPYHPHIDQHLIDDLQKRLHNSNDILTTYENSYADQDLGVTKEWIEETLGVWRGDYDWLVLIGMIVAFRGICGLAGVPLGSETSVTSMIHVMDCFTSNEKSVWIE